jgi:hypothetical protein
MKNERAIKNIKIVRVLIVEIAVIKNQFLIKYLIPKSDDRTLKTALVN